MKLLVVGGGGREHAIIKKLKENPEVEKIYALPGNGGIADDAECVNIKAKDIEGIVTFAAENGVDYAVVAPDDPLVLGCVDALSAVGIPCFGPDKKAAIIEGSKVFSKNLMKKYGIPTAAYETFDDMDKALEYLIRNIRRRMIIVIVTDMEGIHKVNDSLMRQLVLTHDVLMVNVSDADIFGKKVYGVNKENYLPAFITESKKLRKLQQQKKAQIIEECDNKLKRFGIAMTTVNTVNRIDSSLIELLEKHKLRK